MKIALVGNQNSGKTTLFNLLTGSNQKVGNWPGVTIEQKSGIIKGTADTLIDLPGIYSLSPYTAEESLSREFVFTEKPDLIINIIDATNIERSLYLTTQLLELDTDVIIALNMADILLKKGIKIDKDKLSNILNTTIVEISALKNTGTEDLINYIKDKNYLKNIHQRIFEDKVEEAIDTVLTHIHMPHERFSAVKMLENDPKIGVAHIREIEGLRDELEEQYKIDIEQIIADQRYKYIIKVKKECCESIPVKESITKKLDKVFLNRWLAIPIFLVIMAFVYFLSVGLVGPIFSKWINILFNGNDTFLGLGGWFAKVMSEGGASNWSISLVKDGIVAGVGSVLTFIPQIIILFFCISCLETTGYMSRIAFFFDRIFHKFGLSGKSLIPFIVGSGCSVPGIMTSRIVEDNKEKRITVALTPMIPCSAKLPIISAFAAYIVGNNPMLGFLVAFGAYVLAIFLILIYAFILNKLVIKSDSTSFLSELPDYKLPSMKYVGRDVFDKTLEFVERAGTIILVSSIAIWILLSFTWSFKYVDNVNYTIESSMLGTIGKGLSFFFYPMTGGLAGDHAWALAVASLQGLIAKEQVVSCMQVIEASSGGPYFTFFYDYPVVAIAYLAFVLYSIPCFGSISATHKETGSWSKTIKICLFQLCTAWILSSLIGGIGVVIANAI